MLVAGFPGLHLSFTGLWSLDGIEVLTRLESLPTLRRTDIQLGGD